VAIDANGTQFEGRPLKHGLYKEMPNNVTLPGGEVHWYCPVSDVEAEMTRLLDEVATAAYVASPPVVQSAYLHHALTVIHPFADGNGRVARAAASIPLYRSAGVPLVIFADQSVYYRAALMEADAGRRQPFVQFIEDRALDALNLIRQQFDLLRIEDPAARLGRLLTGHGGLHYAEIEQVGYRLRQDLGTSSMTFLKARLPPGIGISQMSVSDRCTFGRPYHSPPGQSGFKIRLSCSEPVHTAVDCTPMVGVADQVAERFVFTAIDANRPTGTPLLLRLDELHPTVSPAAQLRAHVRFDWAFRV
jgi:hypothetical protein